MPVQPKPNKVDYNTSETLHPKHRADSESFKAFRALLGAVGFTNCVAVLRLRRFGCGLGVNAAGRG